MAQTKFKIFNFLAVFVILLFLPNIILAHQPRIIYWQKGDISISGPEISQAFYDELKGEPRSYFLESGKDFNFYLNLLVPEFENRTGRYSADVFLVKNGEEEKSFTLNGDLAEWQEYYEEFGRDYYMKGPELEQILPAGKYKIQVFSKENTGKYVLAVGKKEAFGPKSVLDAYWQIPLLKIQFFKSSLLQFFLTPFGIGAIAVLGGFVILSLLIYFLFGLISQAIKHNQAKTLLLTSGGMPEMKDEIIKLLQKPAYDITVGFITTASKPEEDKTYLETDRRIMQDEMGFNLEEIDIEGKTEKQVFGLLKLKDIIFVEGGNTFYLLNAMRKCNFERVIRKLLKFGKVYIGVSAGSIVAGRTIKNCLWTRADKNFIGLKNLKGMSLVPFDIFVHYKPEDAEIIKQQIKNPKKCSKRLRILTDEQAILVQGKDIMLIGEGEQIIV